VREFVVAHLRSRQVSRVIYGSIIGLAVVVVLESHPPSAGSGLASMLATAFAVGLAELYSDLIGEQLRTGRRIDRHAAVEELDAVAAVAFGVAFPGLFFLLAAIGLFSVDTAIDIAKWTGVGLITLYAFAGARVTGRPGHRALVEAIGIGLIGAVVIGLKALVH
jgi:hypothetical protein